MNFKLIILAAMAAFVVVDAGTVVQSFYEDTECKTKATDASIITACNAAAKGAESTGEGTVTNDCDTSASWSLSASGKCEIPSALEGCTATGLGGSMKMACSANAVFSSVLVVAVAVFANS